MVHYIERLASTLLVGEVLQDPETGISLLIERIDDDHFDLCARRIYCRNPGRQDQIQWIFGMDNLVTVLERNYDRLGGIIQASAIAVPVRMSVISTSIP